MTDYRDDPLYAWLCEAIDMEDDPDQRLGLKRLRARLRTHDSSRKAWIEAAKQALAGDMRALRLRVEMAEAPPVEVVLSA